MWFDGVPTPPAALRVVSLGHPACPIALGAQACATHSDGPSPAGSRSRNGCCRADHYVPGAPPGGDQGDRDARPRCTERPSGPDPRHPRRERGGTLLGGGGDPSASAPRPRAATPALSGRAVGRHPSGPGGGPASPGGHWARPPRPALVPALSATGCLGPGQRRGGARRHRRAPGQMVPGTAHRLLTDDSLWVGPRRPGHSGTSAPERRVLPSHSAPALAEGTPARSRPSTDPAQRVPGGRIWSTPWAGSGRTRAHAVPAGGLCLLRRRRLPPARGGSGARRPRVAGGPAARSRRCGTGRPAVRLAAVRSLRLMGAEAKSAIADLVQVLGIDRRTRGRASTW